MKKTIDNKINSKPFAFSSVDSYIATNIIEGTEKDVRGYDFISWGDLNNYPDYLMSLYRNVPTLQSVVNGATDYVAGNSAFLNVPNFETTVNDNKETFDELLRKIALDYWIYGGFAINVVRNKIGGIACLYYLDFRNIRTNKKNDRFWYSDDWGKSYGRVKYVEYPKYDVDGNEPSSIFYIKNTYNSVYPIPVYSSAAKSAEMLKSIDEYHINAINNGFMASYIISFNNGIPSPEIQEEIEEELNEKFSGYQNSGRIMISFNRDKDNATTVQKLEQDDFSEKYKALNEWCERQIFTSFRANPNLFGIATEGTGFSGEEYENTFKLFNRTMIVPVQKIIGNAFDKIFNTKNCVTIIPFTIDGDKEEIVH